jgi:hypothetical protein
MHIVVKSTTKEKTHGKFNKKVASKNWVKLRNIINSAEPVMYSNNSGRVTRTEED